MYCCGTIHSDHGMLHLNFEGNLNWWQFKIYSHLVILSQYIIYIIVIKEMSIHYQQYMVSKNLKFRESYGSLYQSYIGIQQICEWSAQMQLLQIYHTVEESICSLIATCSSQQDYNISYYETTTNTKASRS